LLTEIKSLNPNSIRQFTLLFPVVITDQQVTKESSFGEGSTTGTDDDKAATTNPNDIHDSSQ
jgi:hypothetical protein